MKRRILSVLLCLCLTATLLPVSVLAEGGAYLALGDSITTGYAPPPHGSGSGDGTGGDEPVTVNFPFAEQIADRYGYTLSNKAEDGETSETLLEKLEAGTIDVTGSDLITITIGGNDLMNALYTYIVDVYNSTPGALYEGKLTVELLQSLFQYPEALLIFVTEMDIIFGCIPDFVDDTSYTAALEAFGDNLKRIIARITAKNPSAQIIITTQYDPYSHLKKEDGNLFTDYVDPIKNTLAQCAREMTEQITVAVDLANNSHVKIADVYTAFQDDGGALTNASFLSMSFDFHPNQAGHDLIAKTIGTVLGRATTSMDVTPSRTYTFPTQEENYIEASGKKFTITNSGTAELTNIQVTLASEDGAGGEGEDEAPASFTLETGSMKTTLATDETATFTVTPKAGLDPGTYTGTVTVSADGITPVTIDISFTVIKIFEDGDHKVLDSDGHLLNCDNDLSNLVNWASEYAKENGSCTIVMGSDDELLYFLTPGITLCVPSGITLETDNPGNIDLCTLEVEVGAALVLGDETFIGPASDPDVHLQLTEGSITWEDSALTLKSGSVATVPAGQTFDPMVVSTIDRNVIVAARPLQYRGAVQRSVQADVPGQGRVLPLP